MKIYGLIGIPLGHSFSQKYFTEKFTRENITGCRYVNFELRSIEKEIIPIKNDRQVFGLNVTIPYKSEIIAFLDNLSPQCQEINACNCIQIAGGKWTGFNTDIAGFEKSFTPLLKPHHTKALVLGTGGSSKAVAYVLKKLNIDFLFVSRKKGSSKNIVDYDFISPATLKEFPIVINTTPIGMFPNVDACPQLPYDAITYENYFFDLIYNPSATLFLSKAAAMGAQINNGEKMLSIQAEESWHIWNTIN